MGNVAECTGDCAFKKLEAVGVMEHAEALSALEVALEHEEQFGVLLDAITRAGAESDLEASYRALQAQARVITHASAEWDGSAVSETVEPLTLWLCKTCGQIEASVPCIGVCVRRNEEVVRLADHAAVLTKLAETSARLRAMRRIATSLAHVTPKAGQWRAAVDAMRKEAVAIGASRNVTAGR